MGHLLKSRITELQIIILSIPKISELPMFGVTKSNSKIKKMKEITVRNLSRSDIETLVKGTVLNLPIVFTGSEEACRAYCEMFTGYQWKEDESIFGGYYAHEDGNCLLLV